MPQRARLGVLITHEAIVLIVWKIVDYAPQFLRARPQLVRNLKCLEEMARLAKG